MSVRLCVGSFSVCAFVWEWCAFCGGELAVLRFGISHAAERQGLSSQTLSQHEARLWVEREVSGWIMNPDSSPILQIWSSRRHWTTLRYETCMAWGLAAHLNLTLSRIVTVAHSKTQKRKVCRAPLSPLQSCKPRIVRRCLKWTKTGGQMRTTPKEARSWLPAERKPCSAKLRRAGCFPAPLQTECCVRKSYSI